MIDPRTDRVLITGAAGAIGTALRDGLRANWHRLRLTDIQPVQNLTDNEEAVVADIADRSAMEAMMQDVRAVVHLAGVLGNYDLEALFRVNARGLFDVFEAARLAGVERIVFASSNHAFGCYPITETVSPALPPRPDSLTGGGANVPAGHRRRDHPVEQQLGFIASKVATAIAAGSTIVVKPSEMSAIQTQVMAEAVHAAGVPKGVINIVNGYGPVVGAALSAHPDIAKISFTGSTVTGRAILTAAAETFKRVTLELGGKGPQIILEDADLATAIPIALASGFANSGQACIAGTRLLVPESRLDESAGTAEGARRRHEGRRRDRSRGADRPDGEPEAMGPGPVLYPPRHRRRRGAADRRRGAARRVGAWLVRAPDYIHARHQPDADCARGDFRAGAVRHPLSRRGRSDRDRQ